MATKKDLTKEEKIKREFSRLKRIFKDLDKNKLQTVESLIKNAAFMAVSLEELQEIINEEGYTVEYCDRNYNGGFHRRAVRFVPYHAAGTNRSDRMVFPRRRDRMRRNDDEASCRSNRRQDQEKRKNRHNRKRGYKQ